MSAAAGVMRGVVEAALDRLREHRAWLALLAWQLAADPRTSRRLSIEYLPGTGGYRVGASAWTENGAALRSGRGEGPNLATAITSALEAFEAARQQRVRGMREWSTEEIVYPLAFSYALDLDEIAGGDLVALVARWRDILDSGERRRVENETISAALEGDYPRELATWRPEQRERWKARAIEHVIARCYEEATRRAQA